MTTITITAMRRDDVLKDEQSREAFAAAFREDGVVVMTDVVGPEEREQLKADAAHFSETRTDGEKPYAPYHHIHLAERAFGRVVRTKSLVAAADILAGGRVDLVQSLFYFKPPGYLGFNRHQDNHFVRAVPADAFVIAWMAIDAADQENGCMYVYPGSHRLPILEVREADPERGSTQSRTVHEHYGEIEIPKEFPSIPLTLEAGAVGFMHANLVHGSWNNTSRDRFRRALSLDYIAAGATFRPGNSAKRERIEVHDGA